MVHWGLDLVVKIKYDTAVFGGYRKLRRENGWKWVWTLGLFYLCMRMAFVTIISIVMGRDYERF